MPAKVAVNNEEIQICGSKAILAKRAVSNVDDT
jgi:hypothetical protein